MGVLGMFGKRRPPSPLPVPLKEAALIPLLLTCFCSAFSFHAPSSFPSRETSRRVPTALRRREWVLSRSSERGRSSVLHVGEGIYNSELELPPLSQVGNLDLATESVLTAVKDGNRFLDVDCSKIPKVQAQSPLQFGVNLARRIVKRGQMKVAVFCNDQYEYNAALTEFGKVGMAFSEFLGLSDGVLKEPPRADLYIFTNVKVSTVEDVWECVRTLEGDEQSTTPKAYVILNSQIELLRFEATRRVALQLTPMVHNQFLCRFKPVYFFDRFLFGETSGRFGRRDFEFETFVFRHYPMDFQVLYLKRDVEGEKNSWISVEGLPCRRLEVSPTRPNARDLREALSRQMGEEVDPRYKEFEDRALNERGSMYDWREEISQDYRY
uniref:DUF1995 domain-containing protein n=1 Tax=Chromera velia CCMP2878 TaxID=1169474 RepID=A0A0G4F707_9ALVE|eukprot:Cvel_15559.t1-p1 / transcript=Cvel_15559.t1 / gene=Cvel_15559 / organism=Chromera_velia_CCMP2878 / gene_product=hypothetical protein / transcript_product=hypothetical protein / location=Cvel_scaffold1156:40709-47317(-) / protein_length=380 / sequence_SO=supercontig / SO=protein_coding / is_pseudo=false